jgi:hypothetical protein
MKTTIGILILIVIGAVIITALIAHRYQRQSKRIKTLEAEIAGKNKLVSLQNQTLGRQLLFIHHSVGSQWLKEGDLSTELLKRGFGVHDATYGDQIGENTDMCDWTGKFSGQMDKILKFDYHPDIYYDGPLENDIIMFKSCFPNSEITGDGAPPGDSNSRTKLTWNYKATMEALRAIFAKYPQKTFIFVTPPPLVPSATTPENADRARDFDNWVKKSFFEQNKQDMKLKNFLVFDLFDVLADSGNYLKANYRRSISDSHPNSTGLKEATKVFIDFLKSNELLKKE